MENPLFLLLKQGAYIYVYFPVGVGNSKKKYPEVNNQKSGN
jgi:hypothetical protein